MDTYFVELTGIGKSHLNHKEIDAENIEDDEALIKAEYSLISAGTELSRAYGLKKGFSYPVQPGYSMVGRIVRKGKNIDLDIGERVFCNAPHASLVRWKNGDDVQGPFIMKIDEDIDPIEATAMNLILVALQGVNLTEVKTGDLVGVYGLGNIGIITALIYQKLGSTVIGIDPVKKRCALAKKLGLKYTAFEEKKEVIGKLGKDRGLDIALDVTGLSDVIIDCISDAKRCGQVLLLGSPRQSYECDIMPVFSMIHMKDLKVLGGFNRTIAIRPGDGRDDCMERNFRIGQELIRNRDIDIRHLVTSIIDPSDCQKAYEDLMYHKDRENCIVYDWRKY